MRRAAGVPVCRRRDGAGTEPAAARAAIDRLDNVMLEEAPYRLEWMAGAAADLTASRQWLTSLARRHGAGLIHVNGYAPARLDADCPILVVAHSDVLSWWQGGSWSNPRRRNGNGYRREVAGGLAAADRIVAPSRAVLDDLAIHYGMGSR